MPKTLFTNKVEETMSTLYWNTRQRLRQKGQEFSITVIRVKLFAWGAMMALVKLGLYAVEAFLSDIIEIGPEWTLALTVANRVLSGLILILWGLLFLSLLGWLVKGAAFLWPLFEREKVVFEEGDEAPPAEETSLAKQDAQAGQEVVETLDVLQALTESAVADKRTAGQHLSDAATYSETLFALVEGFVQRGLHYQTQTALLTQIIEACTEPCAERSRSKSRSDQGGNVVALAQEISDDHLRATIKQQADIALLGPKSKASFNDFVGACRQDYARQVASYDAFVAKLLLKLGDIHKQITDAQTQLQQGDTLEPMLLLLGNLKRAQTYLAFPSLALQNGTGATTANVRGLIAAGQSALPLDTHASTAHRNGKGAQRTPALPAEETVAVPVQPPVRNTAGAVAPAPANSR
jgi:hypothetical protein